MNASQVTKVDTRTPRTPDNTKHLAHLKPDSAQGTIYCAPKDRIFSENERITEKDILNFENFQGAILVFDSQTILTNRHLIIDENADSLANSNNCFFRHLGEGMNKIYRVSKNFQHPPFKKGDSIEDYQKDDIMLMRLENPVESGGPISKDNIIIGKKLPLTTPLSITANYAKNYKPDPWTPTIEICAGMSPITFNGIKTNLTATACNTGKGTSGEPVWGAERFQQQKLYGLVRGQVEKAPPGSGYNFEKNRSDIITFDDSLGVLYEDLKAQK